MDTYERIDLDDGRVIQIVGDEYCDSPREYDNLGTLAVENNRYVSGDEELTAENEQELTEQVGEPLAIVLPVYAYSHGMTTISVEPFSCPWDSGQVGVYYITRRKLLSEYGGKRVTKQLRERVTGYMVNEIEEYAAWMRGETYGYRIVKPCPDHGTDCPHADVEDACYGFIGMEWAIQAAQEAA